MSWVADIYCSPLSYSHHTTL